MDDLMIFDLQRFALHDGPGIRTTVFLKGCPLDCVWCHNPESKKSKRQLGFLEKNCTGCARCADVCPNNVHSITKDGIHKIDADQCVQCGKCVKACLNKALKIYGQSVSAESIIETAMKDEDFYIKSGGGLTVSGGEAMMQFDGLMKLVMLAKERGLHVCLDTCGQAAEDKYLKIAPYIDIFLFDYKITDPEKHRKYIGTDNRLILKNLDTLCRAGNTVYLRCPIIPGINDNMEHYQAIADLSNKYDSIAQVNLMMYHDMAKGKAAQIGEKYELAGLKSISAERKREIYGIVEKCGCRNLKEG